MNRLAQTIGCDVKALALFRITLGVLLTIELFNRFWYIHPFYSDEGTLPLKYLLPSIDPLYKILCIHCQWGSLYFQYFLLAVQLLTAISFTLGYWYPLTSKLCWFLYLSSTLRNTWLSFILDRYFHYLLFYAMLLPEAGEWYSIAKSNRPRNKADNHNHTVVSMATLALKLQILWIYIDAGVGKYSDPLGGWTYHADPLPALDTYVRHTLGGQYLYAILGSHGLRLLTPTVVWAEIGCVPMAFLGLIMGWDGLVKCVVALMVSLHLGIAITLRNTVLLSLVACSSWMVFLPFASSTPTTKPYVYGRHLKRNAFLIIPFVAGSIWFETMSDQCDQSMEHIWSTMLHNRWNVFVGAEEYVTWEIAPGRLRDGSIVDVWSQSEDIAWDMPGTGSPCTSTARGGRWRSFPYLAGIEERDPTGAGEALWGYLCRQWNSEYGYAHNDTSKELIRYNFFMLQADVLPEMAFSATRKRLIYSMECGEDGGGITKKDSQHNLKNDGEL